MKWRSLLLAFVARSLTPASANAFHSALAFDANLTHKPMNLLKFGIQDPAPIHTSMRTPVSSEATTMARRRVETASSRPERKRFCARWSRFISPPWLSVSPNRSDSAACNRS